MNKKLLYSLFICILFAMPAFAEKIPVKITPIQQISTNDDNNQIVVGDWIKFQVVNDVYLNNKLFIQKYSAVTGVVDFVHQNGWAGDSAEVWFSTFYLTGINGKSFSVSYPLKIKGICEEHNAIKQAFAYYILRLVRGAEIFIEPDTKIYNIFIEQ